ncbi:BAH and coiled-coil domain-containing protein 1 isoform X2 [Pleurodeles waltl]|uniref:BAH and coiled-coil domain-containing protein 1 isoform X2 n=1 Tax=Pleurodeles waltl TaxID=8319 RepID=UPI003709B39D
MDGRDFAPPPHLLSDRGSLAHRSAARGAVQHPGPFQAGKYFPSPIAMGAHSGSMMANSSASLMGTFLTSGLGSAPAHPAVPTSSPSEPAFRGPHGAGASQLWFSHSHEAPGYPRFSGGLASTFIPMSHLDHHSNSNVLYGQHRFYESQKDNFYLRNLPAQPTLLSANHNFPSIARAAPGHPIGSCSRDRENSHMQKGHKDSDRYVITKEPGKEKMGKGESKERQAAEEDGKDRGKGVVPMAMDGHCKEDMHQRSSCDNHRKKLLNSCLMTSKVLNGDPGKAMMSSCTGGVLHQGGSMSQNRCAKEKMRPEQDFSQQQAHDPAQHQYGECLERRQMLHHSVAYTVPSSLPNIPPPLNSTSGSFPCLQLRSNPEVMCSLQDKASRELKMSGATFVPSVGHLSDPSQSFQMASEACHGDRTDHSKERGHDMAGTVGHHHHTHHHHPHPHPHHVYGNSFPHSKAEGKGERRAEWSSNAAAARLKNLEYLNSATSDSPYPSVHHPAKNCLEKGGYFEMPPSQDCSRPNHQEALCVKLSQSCCTLDRPPKESQGQGSQKVARIRHQQHRPPEMEQTGSVSDAKRKSIELSSLGYNGPHLAHWAVQGQGPAISISEERKNPYLDPFSTSLQQAALMTQGSVLSQDMQAPPDEVSAMKNLLKYSSQALIVGQKAPFVGFGNMKASCAHQEGKIQSGKGQQEVERPDCARSRENEPPQGDGEVRQPPVGIAVAVARQKDTQSRQEPSYGNSSHRQSRTNQAMKAVNSARSMHVVDLDAEEERSRLCDERLGLTGRELLLQENKDFSRMHPSSGCPGDLTSHLMMAGSSSLQPGQLGGDPASHTHPGHPHWLPRTRSPSIWMGGHSYGIGHPALHQNLPPGFTTAMSGAMQPVFPLSQDSAAQLVILPPEPSPHAAAHPLADVMDQASLWPPMYPGRGPATHIQHPGQLPVYSRSQFLRQQELYALQQQQQRAAQALEVQRPPPPPQRKSEDHQMEFAEPVPERTPKSSQRAVALNSSKSFSSNSLPPPSCPPKLSPFCHSPAPRHSSKCPTPSPLTPCTLPVCPATSPALAPRSPAVSPVVSQNSKGKEAEEKRVEGQPPQDFPKSLEPDLPPGYTYPAVSMGYSSPSLSDVHSADPADPDAMQTAPTAAEPEQSRTATPSGTPHCDEPCAAPQVEAEATIQGDVEKEEVTTPEAKEAPEEQPVPEVLPSSEVIPVQGDLDGLGGIECGALLSEETPQCESHTEPAHEAPEEIPDSEEETVEQVTIISTIPSPNTSEETLVDIKNLEEQALEKEEEVASGKEAAPEESEEVTEEKQEVDMSAASPNEVRLQGSVSSLEALIAATINLGDLPALLETSSSPSGPPSSLDNSSFSYNSGNNGIALLSELASLEFNQQKSDAVNEYGREDLVALNLQSLATIAAAWSLVETNSVDTGPPDIRLLNNHCFAASTPLIRPPRRKFTWVPKVKPVCPLKAAIDELDTEEVEIRMRLAELQRRYKEKQRELVKLQRRHEREDSSRSPARRGPGRPRKRKHSCSLSSIRHVTPQSKFDVKKVKPLKSTVSRTCSDSRSDEEPKRKKCNLSEGSYGSLVGSEASVTCKSASSSENSMMSKLDRKVSQLKQKAKNKALPPSVSPFRRKEGNTGSKLQKKLCQGRTSMVNPRQRHGDNRATVMKSKPCAFSSTEPEKDEGEDSDSEGGSDDIPDRSPKEPNLNLHTSSNASTVGPSPSSVVKMEANQKAKKKKERQELLGSCPASSPEGEVKVRKRPVAHRADMRATSSKMTRLPVRKKSLASEGEHKKTKATLRRRIPASPRILSSGMVSAAEMGRIASERIKKATRKNKALQSALRRKNGTLGLALSTRNPRIIKDGKKLKSKQPPPKQGRAVSKLLASFTVEDDFQFDDNSSFSEGEDEDNHNSESASTQKVLPAPICTISRDDLREGLHVLIPKEDSLLYAGSIKTLQPPDIYSIVIEGERGNRQRIYSLEQLLQEAVLDIKPQSVRALPPGTRVCAYWSQKSRCLYPGNVVRGSSSDDDEEANSVVVAFDDGDTGRISLPNIRLLPADYTIKCTEPSPALLVAAGSRRTKRSSGCLPPTSEGPESQAPEGREVPEQPKAIPKKVANKERPGKAETVNSGSRSLLTADRSNSLMSWSAMSQTKRKAGGKTPSLLQNLFQLNGSARRLKAKEAAFPVTSMSAPIFGNGFGVHSFSSIANSYSRFTMGNTLAPAAKPLRVKRAEKVPGEEGKSMGKKRSAEYLIKLDHEGVTSPKTKNSKALLMCAKDFGLKAQQSLQGQGFSHPPLVGKDKKCRTRVPGLPVGLTLRKYSGPSQYELNCDSDCHSSYSDMEEERTNRGDGVTSRYLTRLSGSSSSSGSSTSSSSGSTSSLSSSDNEDSSYSSEVEDSTLLLQTCLSHPGASLLTPAEALHTKNSGPQRCFVAKATAVGGPAKVKRKEAMSFSKVKELPRRQRLPSVENRPKISAFLPARQLWKWSGNPTQRRGMKGKARKLFYKAIVRGKETLHLGDCAVFLSAGRPNLPYIGRIESMWESWGSNMVVKVKWFYHPEETKLGKRQSDGKNALYQSCHEDENDVQTVSHRCQVVSREQYEQMTRSKRFQDRQDLYYLAGTYDPTTGRLVTADGVPVLC